MYHGSCSVWTDVQLLHIFVSCGFLWSVVFYQGQSDCIAVVGIIPSGCSASLWQTRGSHHCRKPLCEMTCKNHIVKQRQTYARAILKSPLGLFIYLIHVSLLSGNKEVQSCCVKWTSSSHTFRSIYTLCSSYLNANRTSLPSDLI